MNKQHQSDHQARSADHLQALTRALSPSPKRRFDLVLSDNDGCLVNEGQTPFDLESLAAIARHNAAAIANLDRPVLTLCTGRPQPFAEAMCRLTANLVVPCIAEHGVWLYEPAHNQYLLDPQITPEHARAVRLAETWLHDEFARHGTTHQPGKTHSVSVYHPDPAFLRTLEKPIRDKFESEGWPIRVSMTWYYINCDLKHISKATGIERLLSMCHVDRHRIAGIGDTMSDLAIKDRVGTFCCPANAQEQLKEHADIVANTPEARGVVELLETLSN